MVDSTVTACLVIIGNEILSGRTKDKNLAHIAERLNDWGIRLMEARVVPDVEETIIATVNEVRTKFDYVFTTGGIGPTHDDITAECIAKAFGLPHVIHPVARAKMAASYKSKMEANYKSGQLNEARLRMATMPQGALLIENDVSFAPGFQVENVFVMAGIPDVMHAMLEALEGRLKGARSRRSLTIKAFLPEGDLAGPLGALQDEFPDVEIGSYPFHEDGRFGARLVMSGIDEALLEKAGEKLDQLLAGLNGERVWEGKAAPGHCCET